MRFNILFYTDWNNNIGIGHVMRCKAIANMASEKGLNSIFISSSKSSSIISNDFECVIIDSRYNDLNAEKLKAEIDKHKPELVVIDSYYVTFEYLKNIKRSVNSNNGKLLYIDDCLFFDYPCDLILNYNIYGLEEKNEYEKMFSNDTSGKRRPDLILGAQYVPVRKEFQGLGDRIIRKRGVNVLVSTGGADTEHITLEFLEKAKKYASLYFHIIVGPLNVDKNEIMGKADDCKNVEILENVQSMCEVMQSVDVAISASGSTLYELCVTQTPTITYVVADNQKKAASSFEKYNIMKNAGDIRDTSKEAFVNNILQMALDLANDYDERQHMQLQMKKNIDDRGCERILEVLINNRVFACT